MYWYESMMLQRKFEEKAGQLYGQQKIRGFCHLILVRRLVLPEQFLLWRKEINTLRLIVIMANHWRWAPALELLWLSFSVK
jgi:hypothetical protein